MKRSYLLAASSATAFAAALVPASAASIARPSHPATIAYRTTISGVPGHSTIGGMYNGTLRLTFNPDGIVQGTYVPSSGSPLPVSGGVDEHGTIWLDFGMGSRMRMTGRLHEDKHIDGTVSGPPLVNRSSFSAIPEKKPAP